MFVLALFFEYAILGLVIIKNTQSLKKSLDELTSPDQLEEIPEACHESLFLK